MLISSSNDSLEFSAEFLLDFTTTNHGGGDLFDAISNLDHVLTCQNRQLFTLNGSLRIKRADTDFSTSVRFDGSQATLGFLRPDFHHSNTAGQLIATIKGKTFRSGTVSVTRITITGGSKSNTRQISLFSIQSSNDLLGDIDVGARNALVGRSHSDTYISNASGDIVDTVANLKSFKESTRFNGFLFGGAREALSFFSNSFSTLLQLFSRTKILVEVIDHPLSGLLEGFNDSSPDFLQLFLDFFHGDIGCPHAGSSTAKGFHSREALANTHSL